MIDLKWLRENADAYDHMLQNRGAEPQAQSILALDETKRVIETALQHDQSRRNALSKQIGQKRGPDGKPSPILLAEVAELKAKIKDAEDRLRDADATLQTALSSVPNLLAVDVPIGPDETANREQRRWREPRVFNFKPQPHEVLGARFGMDFESAVRISGARFVALRGKLARLERALGAFMLDVQTLEHGYSETSVPLIVQDAAAFGTNQLPKFKDDLFRTTTGHWLIPTAEVSLTNLVREQILDETQLPIRLTAFTPCFRLEAGAAGRDTKGMIRQHQFWKVELVSITSQEASWDEHERMTACAEDILKRLDLPYRVMTLSSGDTGFGAAKTHDLEVWLPGQNTYREISSCSNCRDFQARRMNARYRARGEKQTQFVHTLNGSGLAVGRALIAVLENYQEADGSVVIPETLRPYMGGTERLEPGVT